MLEAFKTRRTRRRARRALRGAPYSLCIMIAQALGESRNRSTRAVAAEAAARAVATAPTVDMRARALRLYEALCSGRRVKFATYPATTTTDGTDPVLARAVDAIFEERHDDE